MSKKRKLSDKVQQPEGGLSKKSLAVFQAEFREDLQWWVVNDRKTALRIMTLIEDVMRDPFTGFGKPEPLKHLGGGVWSRRITQRDRLVYLVKDKRVDFLQCRYHY